MFILILIFYLDQTFGDLPNLCAAGPINPNWRLLTPIVCITVYPMERRRRRVTNAANFSDTVSNCPISDGEEVKRKTFLTATLALPLSLSLLTLLILPMRWRKKRTLAVILWKCGWRTEGRVHEFSFKSQKTAHTTSSRL